MFKILIALLLFSSQAVAGLPPTTSKVSGDSTNLTTFNYQFPNFTGTHTGTTVSLGTLSVAGGGTGLTATPTNGQIDIGNGTGFTRTTLTAGSNITITNGVGSISISSAASGTGNLTAIFTLDDATVPYLNFARHIQTTTQTLSTVNIGLLNCGTSGSTTIRLNQYHNSTAVSSATATIAASIDSGGPCTSIGASLSGSLNLVSGDYVTADLVTSAGGSPEGLNIEW